MTTETYLRRSLIAPVIVPVLAGIPLLQQANAIQQIPVSSIETLGIYVSWFLICSLCIGGIPYLWMLYARRDFLLNANGAELEEAWWQLPGAMLPYFWKFWGVLTACLLVTIWGALYGLAFLVIGTIAVPILGYAYIGITFGFLRLFQAVGLVQKGTNR